MVFFVATFFVRTLLAELCPAPCLDAVEAFTPVEAFLTAFLVGLPADFVGRLEVVLPAPFEAVLLAFWVAFLVAVLRAPALLAVFLAALLEGVEVEREPARAFAVCGEPLFEDWREESATGKPLMLVNVRTSMVKIFSFSNFFVLFLFCSQECNFSSRHPYSTQKGALPDFGDLVAYFCGFDRSHGDDDDVLRQASEESGKIHAYLDDDGKVYVIGLESCGRTDLASLKPPEILRLGGWALVWGLCPRKSHVHYPSVFLRSN